MKRWLECAVAAFLVVAPFEGKADPGRTADQLNQGATVVVGRQNPEYYFQKVIPFSAQLLFANITTEISNFICNFEEWQSCEDNSATKWRLETIFGTVYTNQYYVSGSGDARYFLSNAGHEFIRLRIQHLNGDTRSIQSITQDAIMTKIKNFEKDGVLRLASIDSSVTFSGGYCLGIVLWAGTILEVRELMARKETNGSLSNKYLAMFSGSSDSAICYGSVSRTPPNLPLNSPDIRALRETMLLITGLVPYTCVSKPATPGAPAAGAPSEETCSFDRPRVEPRP